jgi:DNA-binding LacI/PurR family transcriptional regulator
VGFDDSPAARHSDPPLTTVRQDVGAKGRLAAAALTAAIEHARSGTPGRVRHHVLPTELVVRGSTAVAPANPGRA